MINWFVFYFDYAYLIRLCDIIKPTLWPLPLQSIFTNLNAHNFPIFQWILMKLASKSMIQSSFFINILIIRVAVPFNDPKFSDRQVRANSADPDQTAPKHGVHVSVVILFAFGY